MAAAPDPSLGRAPPLKPPRPHLKALFQDVEDMEDGEEGGPGDPPVRVNMSTLKAWVGGRVRRINIPSKYQVTRAGLYTFALLNSA